MPTIRQARSSDWPGVVAVFAMVIGFTYSDDLVELGFVVAGRGGTDTRWAVFLVDILLVLATAGLAWRMAGLDARRFVVRLLRSWWPVGAVAVVVLHILTAAISASTGLHLLGAVLFALAMGVVLVSALEAGAPRGGTLRRNGWVIPLVVGTCVVQIASVLWFPIIDTHAGCANEISTDFFAQMVQVIPVMLITLGLETNFVRRSRRTATAVPILTVVLLSVALLLSFSMLVKADEVHCGAVAVWHEYLAFVLTVHATAIALATLVWLLIVGEPEPR